MANGQKRQPKAWNALAGALCAISGAHLMGCTPKAPEGHAAVEFSLPAPEGRFHMAAGESFLPFHAGLVLDAGDIHIQKPVIPGEPLSIELPLGAVKWKVSMLGTILPAGWDKSTFCSRMKLTDEGSPSPFRLRQLPIPAWNLADASSGSGSGGGGGEDNIWYSTGQGTSTLTESGGDLNLNVVKNPRKNWGAAGILVKINGEKVSGDISVQYVDPVSNAPVINPCKGEPFEDTFAGPSLSTRFPIVGSESEFGLVISAKGLSKTITIPVINTKNDATLFAKNLFVVNLDSSTPVVQLSENDDLNGDGKSNIDNIREGISPIVSLFDPPSLNSPNVDSNGSYTFFPFNMSNSRYRAWCRLSGNGLTAVSAECSSGLKGQLPAEGTYTAAAWLADDAGLRVSKVAEKPFAWSKGSSGTGPSVWVDGLYSGNPGANRPTTNLDPLNITFRARPDIPSVAWKLLVGGGDCGKDGTWHDPAPVGTSTTLSRSASGFHVLCLQGVSGATRFDLVRMEFDWIPRSGIDFSFKGEATGSPEWSNTSRLIATFVNSSAYALNGYCVRGDTSTPSNTDACFQGASIFTWESGASVPSTPTRHSALGWVRTTDGTVLSAGPASIWLSQGVWTSPSVSVVPLSPPMNHVRLSFPPPPAPFTESRIYVSTGSPVFNENSWLTVPSVAEPSVALGGMPAGTTLYFRVRHVFSADGGGFSGADGTANITLSGSTLPPAMGAMVDASAVDFSGPTSLSALSIWSDVVSVVKSTWNTISWGEITTLAGRAYEGISVGWQPNVASGDWLGAGLRPYGLRDAQMDNLGRTWWADDQGLWHMDAKGHAQMVGGPTGAAEPNGSWQAATAVGFTPTGLSLDFLKSPVDTTHFLYILETAKHRVLQLRQSGSQWEIRLFAGASNGSAAVADVGSNAVHDTETLVVPQALFNGPLGIAVGPLEDTKDVLYVADTLNHCIRRIRSVSGNWTVDSVAGKLDGTQTWCTGEHAMDVGGLPTASSKLEYPTRVAASSHEVYFSEPSANRILRIDLNASPRYLKNAMGGGWTSGSPAPSGSTLSYTDPLATFLSNPLSLAVAAGADANSQTLYVADTGNRRIVSVHCNDGTPAPSWDACINWTLALTIKSESMVAGQPWGYSNSGIASSPTYLWMDKGHPSAADDQALMAIATTRDTSNNHSGLIFVEPYLRSIRRWAAYVPTGSGGVGALVGDIPWGRPSPNAGANSTSVVHFGEVAKAARDAQRNLLVLDKTFATLIRIPPDGQIQQLNSASTWQSPAATPCNGTTFTACGMAFPEDFSVDSSNSIWIADTGAHRILTIPGLDPTNVKVSIGATNSTTPADNAPLLPTTINATDVRLNGPRGVATFHRAGQIIPDVFVADTNNNRILRIWCDSNCANPVLATFVASKIYSSSQFASFYHPAKIAIDGDGALYVTLPESHYVAKLTPNGANPPTAYTHSVFAGIPGSATPVNFAGGDDFALATTKTLRSPTGVAAVGSQPNVQVFISDNALSRVRLVQGGVVSTVAGGKRGFFGDGQPATQAGLGNTLLGLWADPFGNVVIADTDNNRVRGVRRAWEWRTPVAENLTFSFANPPAGFASCTGQTCTLTFKNQAGYGYTQTIPAAGSGGFNGDNPVQVFAKPISNVAVTPVTCGGNTCTVSAYLAVAGTAASFQFQVVTSGGSVSNTATVTINP